MPLRAFTIEEVVLTERRRLELPLLALIWVAATASSLAMGNLFDLLATTVAVAVNLLVALRSREVCVRKVLINAAVIAATISLVLELAGQPTRLPNSLQHYLVLIMLCKLFAHKTNRDYVQMLAMSLLLMVSAAVTHPQIWFAAALVLYLGLCSYVTMIFTLKRGLDAAAHSKLADETAPPGPQQVAWNVIRNWPSGVLLGRMALMLAAMLVFGACIFLTAPRGLLPQAAGMDMDSASSAISGFGGSVHLGDARSVYLSDQVMMEVHLRSFNPGTPPPQGLLYLRGLAYDTYGQQMASAWGRSSMQVGSALWSVAPPDVMDDCFVQEITMSQGLLPTVFGCWPIVRTASGLTHQNVDSLLNLEWTPLVSGAGPVRYEVYSLRPGAVAGHADFLSWLRRRLLDWRNDPLPVRRTSDPRRGVYVHPSVAELAKQWCQDLLDRRLDLDTGDRPAYADARRDELNLAIANRLAERLRGYCSYSLDLSDSDPSRDGVEDFLFHTRRGHCEYFASALAVMCRHLGVQARLATGFCAQEPAGKPDTYVVRGRDAHAWTEVFTPSTDWTVVDATPPGSGAQAKPAGLWARLRQRMHDLQFAWYDKVVGYDDSARMNLAGMLKNLAGRLKMTARQAVEAFKDSLTNLLVYGQVDRAMFLLISLLAGTALAADASLIWRMLRRLAERRRRRLTGGAYWQLAFVPGLLALMERRGLSGSPGRTMRESATAAIARFDLEPQTLRGLVDLYYDVRWGGRVLQAQEISQARASTQKLARTIRKARPK